jgi:hypothetical protein
MTLYADLEPCRYFDDDIEGVGTRSSSLRARRGTYDGVVHRSLRRRVQRLASLTARAHGSQRLLQSLHSWGRLRMPLRDSSRITSMNTSISRRLPSAPRC